MVIVDLLYHCEKDIQNADDLLKKHAATSGYFEYLPKQNTIHVIKHMNANYKAIQQNLHYHFFKGDANQQILNKFIKKLKPDIVIVHGFQNPFWLLLLKLNTTGKLVLQYHGGQQPNLVQLFFQIITDKFISAYFFVEKSQATPFIENRMISSYKKVYEIMEGSNSFKKIDKNKARLITGVVGNPTFLWVGRLDSNKDPLVVLNGFESIAQKNPLVKLYMIYGTDDLLKEVNQKISQSSILQETVFLISKLEQSKLEAYYNSADYFILGSHYEGSGYALNEALACGCIPIVTDIPSFRMMTNDGNIGALWQVGNSDSFVQAALNAMKKDIELESANCVQFFKDTLSYEAIANKAIGYFEVIISK